MIVKVFLCTLVLGIAFVTSEVSPKETLAVLHETLDERLDLSLMLETVAQSSSSMYQPQVNADGRRMTGTNGTYLTIKTYDDCAQDNLIGNQGWAMGVCSVSRNLTASNYSKFSCSKSSNGTVTVYHTTYADDGCSNMLGVLPLQAFNSTECIVAPNTTLVSYTDCTDDPEPYSTLSQNPGLYHM